MGERLHYVDWLRVVAVLLLFPFHVSRVFNAGDPFYVKASSVSVGLNTLLGFIDRWHMPLLFVLAGASTYLAMRKRTGGQYLGERTKRLLVPFLFGWVVLIPPQTFVGGMNHSGYGDSYLHYMTTGDWLVWNLGPGGDYYGGFGVGHLWFILWLLMVSLMAFPLVMWGRGERGHAVLSRIARGLAKPWWWLAAALVIWFMEGLPDIAGKNPFYYLAYFALGYVAMHDPAFMASAERWRWPAVLGGAGVSLAYVLSGAWRGGLADPSWELFFANLAGFLGAWLVIIGVLGLGRRHLNTPGPTLAYLAEGSYPVYMLHQTVIVVAAAVIVTLPLVWPAQWALLFLVSVTGTFVLYEVVRRADPLRVLFGMKRSAKAGAAV